MLKRFLGQGLNETLWNELTAMPGLLIVLTDELFRLEWANDYFYDYFKCRPPEVAGRSMHDFLGDDIWGDMCKKHINRVVAEGHIWDHPARTIGTDGEYVVIRWNQMVVDNSKSKILSIGFPPKAEEVRADYVQPSDSPSRDTWGGGLRDIPNIDNKADDKPESELVLDQMMARENFILHYQPRVAARTKTIIGVEALVRMKHTECGILYPGSFLPTAEKEGQIIEIGSYVMDAACKKLHEWQNSENGMKMTISVNLSPRQVCSKDLVQRILEAVGRYRINPASLMLELTEWTVAANYEKAKEVMQTLRDAGFMVAIDDYRAEFLPPAALARLPIDNIALDRVFIAQSDKEPMVNSVLKSIITLAHGIDITVTASGIENRRQLNSLLDNSVDFLQGYLISEPLPETEFDRFLKTNPDFYTRHI